MSVDLTDWKEIAKLLENFDPANLSPEYWQRKLKDEEDRLDVLRERRKRELAECDKMPSWDRPMGAYNYSDVIDPILSNIKYYKSKLRL